LKAFFESENTHERLPHDRKRKPWPVMPLGKLVFKIACCDSQRHIK